MFNLGVFIIFMLAACIAGGAFHLKHFLNQQQWERLKLLPNFSPVSAEVQGQDNTMGFQEDHKVSNP